MAVVVAQDGGNVVPNHVYRLTMYTFLQNQMAMTNFNFLYATLTGPGGDSMGDVLNAIYTSGINTGWMAAIASALAGTRQVVTKWYSFDATAPPPFRHARWHRSGRPRRRAPGLAVGLAARYQGRVRL